MRSLEVLVVEDEPSNREIVEIILTSAGHRVTTCENGAEALALVRDPERRFDVVLMDILMPVMDGLRATMELRADARTRDLPILCVSARASGTDQAAGEAAGCDCYIRKPYKRKELLAALRETLLKRGVLTPEESQAPPA